MNVGSIRVKLKAKLKGMEDCSVVVGYTAPYAVYVHENLEANHPHGGQAKFLEQPARLLQPELRRIVHERMLQGYSFKDSVLFAARWLLAEANALVPVDTGFLLNSGYAEAK